MKKIFLAAIFFTLTCASTSCESQPGGATQESIDVDVHTLRQELEKSWKDTLENYSGGIELEMTGGQRLSSSSEGACEFVFEGVQYDGVWDENTKRTARKYIGLTMGSGTTASPEVCNRQAQEDATFDLIGFSLSAALLLRFDEFTKNDPHFEVSVLSSRRWEWAGYRLAGIRYSVRAKNGFISPAVPALNGMGPEIHFEVVFAENAPPGAALWQASGRDLSSGERRVDRKVLKIENRELPEFPAP